LINKVEITPVVIDESDSVIEDIADIEEEIRRRARYHSQIKEIIITKFLLIVLFLNN